MIASAIRSRTARWLSVLCGGLLLTACAPATGPASQGGAGATSANSGPKSIRIAFQGFEEPKSGIISFGSAGGFDPLEHFMIFHASLTVYDQQGDPFPRLAEKVPSLKDGDWTLAPDGQMEVTWKLRPNAQWHDGAPLTAQDFAFGARVVTDPEIPATRPTWSRLVSTIDTPDPRTLVVHWQEPWFQAGGSGAADIPALPSHLLSDLYQSGDKQTFVNSSYWTSEFIGLGPYKLSNWQLGSFIEGTAFEQYVLGKPKIDRVLLMYVGDVNTIVAGVLSADLDIVPMGARFDAGQMVAVQTGWGKDAGKTLLGPAGTRTIYLQFRDPTTPWVRDIRVRRAMVHSTDRQGMSDALQFGLTPPADTLLAKEDARFQALEQAGLTRYAFDPNHARQLLADAGWVPGGDGSLKDQQGQVLALDLSATGQGSNVQEIEAVAADWQRIGFKVSPLPLAPQAANLDELKNTVRGGFMWPLSATQSAPQQLSTAQVASERTAWKGSNYAGYSNPAYDDLYDRSVRALEGPDRAKVLIDALRLVADEIPVIPIYYYGNGIVIRKGLDGPGMISPGQTANAWNIHTWDLR